MILGKVCVRSGLVLGALYHRTPADTVDALLFLLTNIFLHSFFQKIVIKFLVAYNKLGHNQKSERNQKYSQSSNKSEHKNWKEEIMWQARWTNTVKINKWILNLLKFGGQSCGTQQKMSDYYLFF